MIKAWRFALVALMTLLLGACDSAEEPTATGTQAPSPTVPQPTATNAPTPTALPAPTAVTTLVPSPTAIATQPPPPTVTPSATPALPDVRPEDWVRGPDHAAVTIIEYSDFQ